MNPSAIKIRLKCGPDGYGDELCVVKDYKVVFPNDQVKMKYLDDQDLIRQVLISNKLLAENLLNDNMKMNIDVIRDISVPLDQWREVVNKHRPNGKGWNQLTDQEKLKFIGKYLNGHPLRSPMSDPVVICIDEE